MQELLKRLRLSIDKKVWLVDHRVTNLFLAHKGKVAYLLRKGSKLRRTRAQPKEHQANISILKGIRLSEGQKVAEGINMLEHFEQERRDGWRKKEARKF